MQYDVVVVGAGSAGLPLAARLALTGRSVALIEAGPDYPTLDQLPDDLRYGHATGPLLATADEHSWFFDARATDEVPHMQVPRGRVTGGSSAVNGQIFLRALVEDYDAWAAAGNDGWSFAEILPYLRRVEDDRTFGETEFHGSGGPIAVRRYTQDEMARGQKAFRVAALEAGFPDSPDQNAPGSTGVGPHPLNNPEGIRISTAVGYLPMVRELENFRLLDRTVARRVVFDGGRAIGIEVQRDGDTSIIEGAEVVLSAGAVCSPHLLMLSGVGPADQLEKAGVSVISDLAGVGQHLQDHPTVYLLWQIRPDLIAPPTTPRTQMTLRWTAPGSALVNDMVINGLTNGPRFGLPLGLNGSLSEGELRLVSADPEVPPTLDYNYFSRPEDLRRMREGVRLCMQLAGSEAFSGFLVGRETMEDSDLASDAAIESWIRRNVTTMHHICGTCKMGPPGDDLAVVDSASRVYGVDGLRVVDTSIMPSVPRGNPNNPAVVSGERIADLMISDGAATSTTSSAAAL